MRFVYDLILWRFPKVEKSSIVFGLAFGLATGLAFGLATGLAFGLATGLAFGLATGLIKLLPIDYTPIAIAVFIIAEVIFWLRKNDATKTKGNDRLMHTLWFKLQAVLDAALIVVNLNNIRKLDFNQVYQILSPWMGYLGFVVIAATIVYVWIWLNSMKYAEKNKTKKR